MSVPDGAGQVIVSGTGPGSETWAFGWWVNDSTDVAGSDLTLNVNWGAFQTELLSHMSSEQVITRYSYRRYEGGVVTRVDQDDVNHPGTDTSGQLPLQISCVLTLRTGTLTRRGRGRIYLPTCGFSMMSGGGHVFSGSQVADLVDKFAAFLTTEAGGAAPPVVVSRTGSSMAPITAVDADVVPDTQRRRRAQLTSTRHSHSV